MLAAPKNPSIHQVLILCMLCELTSSYEADVQCMRKMLLRD